MAPETRQFNLFVLLERSPRLAGVWLAHMPSIDTTMQARSPSKAIEAAMEAAQHLILHDLNHDIEPMIDAVDESREDLARLTRIMISTPMQMVRVDALDEMQHLVCAVIQLPPLRAFLRESPVDEDRALATWSPRNGDAQLHVCE